MHNPRLLLALVLAVAAGVYLGGGTVAPHALHQIAERQAPVLKQAVTHAAQPGSAEAPARLSLADSWHLQEPNTAPLAPEQTQASRQVLATARLDRGSLPNLSALREGQNLLLPVHGSADQVARVTAITTDTEGWVRVSGVLPGSQGGGFFLSQKGPAFFGRVSQPSLGRAYRIATEADGTIIMQQKPLSSVSCAAIPKKPRPAGFQIPAAGLPAAASAAVPLLDSDPTATNVIYIDFDGESVTDPDWNNGHTINAAVPTLNGTRISAAQITDIWNRVVEDYRPFKISITTDLARYNSVGVRHRMRCIVTPTDTAAPGAGGVAWTDSFRQAGIDFSSTVPCWAFAEDYYNTADISGIISHEVGHTMGLSHDGRDNPYEEYFEGQGSGPTSWAPIMGATYDHNVTQWSKGEYYRANNHEDDVAIIGGAANGFGFVADEDTPTTPVNLPTDGVFAINGVIGAKTDVDQYLFATAGGAVKVTAVPAPVEPDLDILLEIRDPTGTKIFGSSNLLNALNASISTTLPLGTYKLVIRGIGEGSALGVGYSPYGSMGAYKIAGSYPPVPVAAPVITSSPTSLGVLAGAKVSFSVSATSSVPPSYQWQKDGKNLPGQTSSTLTITNAQPVNEGTYVCLVSNLAGSSPSDPATLSIFTKPAITHPPVAITRSAGSATPLSFSVTATGTQPLHYQWQHGTTDMPGKTDATLSIDNPQWADAGSYRCVVTNDYGSTASTAAVATILSPPFIVTPPPAAQDVPKGGTGSVSLSAVGSPVLTYQWYHDTTKLVGAVAAKLTLSAITDASAGPYHCVVTNKYGSVTSSDCVVAVRIPPAVTLQPVSQTVHEGNGFQLSVAATGSDTLTYRWQRDGVNVGTGPVYTVGAATWADHGVYRCLVSNTVGTATSKNATVTLQAAPSIVVPPQNAKVAIGAKATLKVVAVGSPTLKYQWRKGGMNIPGAVASSLTIVGATDTSYDVVVSNPYNTAGVPSTPALITAVAPVKITLPPQAKSVAAGGAVDLSVVASGGGTVTYQWKKNNIAISGQTAPTLHLDPVAATDGALYSVTVTNDVGFVTSTAVRLTVLAAPKIVKKPLAASVKAHAPIVLTALATGSGDLAYHWQKDKADIIGITGPTLTIASAQSADAGSYRAVVSNAAGTVYSEPAEVKVVAAIAPQITSFAPNRGPAGSLVRVRGAGLDEIRNVTMAAADGSIAPVPVVIVSPEEALVMVPANAVTSSFAVKGDSGSATAESPFVVTSGPVNVDASSAQILPGTGGKVKATGQTGAVWFTWTPAFSGSWHLDLASDDPTAHLTVYNNDQQMPTPGGVLEVVAGTPFFLAVEGGEPGEFELSVERAQTVYEDYDSVSWLPLDSSAGPFSVRTVVFVGSDGSGQWVLGDSAHQAITGLTCTKGALSLAKTGDALNQNLIPGAPYLVQMEVDTVHGTWGALLNGEWIVRDQSLPQGAVVAGLQSSLPPADAHEIHVTGR